MGRYTVSYTVYQKNSRQTSRRNVNVSAASIAEARAIAERRWFSNSPNLYFKVVGVEPLHNRR